MRGARVAHQHAAASTQPDERCDLPRGRPEDGRTDDARRRRHYSVAHRLRIRTGDGPVAQQPRGRNPPRELLFLCRRIPERAGGRSQVLVSWRSTTQREVGGARTGRVFGGREPDLEPGCGRHQGMTMNPQVLTRRYFFGKASAGLGIAALSTLLQADESAGLPGLPHFPATAKRVIYLFQSGAPSQMDLFDYKPRLKDLTGTELPDSVRSGQRLTGMTSGQTTFPLAASLFHFERHGNSGAWISELMPHTAQVADDLCFVKSMYTEAINHDPAVTFFQTGFQLAGRPSIGAWLAYGLGSENRDLPAFVVMISQGSGNPNDQPLADRQWGSGFLPTKYQGVKFRSGSDPVLYLSDPPGFNQQERRRFIDDLAALNRVELEDFGDPEIATRI